MQVSMRSIPYLNWPPRQQFQKWRSGRVFPRRGFGSTSWALARVNSNTAECFWLRTEQRKKISSGREVKKKICSYNGRAVSIHRTMNWSLSADSCCFVVQRRNFTLSICLINDFLHFLKWGYESCGSPLIVPELLFASGNEFWRTEITQ